MLLSLWAQYMKWNRPESSWPDLVLYNPEFDKLLVLAFDPYDNVSLVSLYWYINDGGFKVIGSV